MHVPDVLPVSCSYAYYAAGVRVYDMTVYRCCVGVVAVVVCGYVCTIATVVARVVTTHCC